MRWGRRFAGLLMLALSAAPPGAAFACTLGRLAELPVTMVDLVPTVPVKVDGVDIKLIADSGAFFNLLTPQAAAKAALHVAGAPLGLPYIVGLAGAEDVRLATAKDFSLAGVTFHKADFLVAAPQLGSEGVDGLLGDNILSYADVEFDLANGVIRLFKPVGCASQTNFGYWATSGVETADITPATKLANHIVVDVKVNGHAMRAVLDSGAGRSFITRVAARAAGVAVDGPGVKPGGMAGGIGHKNYQTWIARFDSFAVGDELIKNAMLRIGDADVSLAASQDAQMLIGADFLLSHRVYVANSERKLYFTYNGGPVFNLDQSSGTEQPASSTAASAPAIPGASPDKPVDAGGFERRAAAFDARHEFAAAIADYTQAIALQPSAEHDYYQRAMEHWRNKEPEAALADLAAALKLKPDDDKALMARGYLRLLQKDESGAAADFEAAVKVEPKDSIGVALAYQNARLFEKAVAAWDQWIAARQNDLDLAQALNGRCWTRALWGQELDLALADCNAALQRSRGSPAILDSRGLVYLRLGQFQASIADYDAALRASPKQAWSLYGRGVDKLRLGRKTEGEADLAAAAAVAPSLPDTAKKYGVAP
jgi:tetratricopeptide (TPR) repeat protein/predicted aspartyl protease